MSALSGGDQRRLAAILAADVVGYSRLMGRDESGTLATLKSHRREVIDTNIAEHRGRIFKTTGDGLLVEFPSVVDAVRCAVEIQRVMAQRNAGVPEDLRLDFRIGINIGDIIIDGDDIFGDGVNVAARLEGLAHPGGVCISGAVRDQVVDKLGFGFEDMGTQLVKNIARPVQAYRVRDDLPPVEKPAMTTESGPPRRRRQALVAGLGIAALVAGGLGLWGLWEIYRPVIGHGHGKAAESASQRPFRSIAVLPFSGEPGAAQDAEGAMARELAHALRRAYPDMIVVSPAMAGLPASVARNAEAIGGRLNVRYVLEGKLRGGAAAELWLEAVDSVERSLVWSGRYPLPATGHAETVNKARVDLRAAIVDATARDIRSLDPNRRAAWESVLKGYGEPTSIVGVQRAQGHFEAALRTDPEFPNALRGLAWALWQRMQDDASLIPALMPRMEEVSDKAVRLVPADPRGWTMRAVALRLGGNLEAAFVATDEALRLDAYDANVLAHRAGLVIYAGRPREAFPVLDRIRELHAGDLNAMTNVAVWECLARFQLNDVEALPACERAAGFWNRWIMFSFPASLHAEAGDRERAALWLAKVLAANPNATLEGIRAVGYLNSPAPAFRHATDRWVEGLRKAGLPEK